MFRATETRVPGYTGYQPPKEEDWSSVEQHAGKTNVPGYCGFISAVKSENVHAKTYGVTTKMSVEGRIEKGIDRSRKRF